MADKNNVNPAYQQSYQAMVAPDLLPAQTEYADTRALAEALRGQAMGNIEYDRKGPISPFHVMLPFLQAQASGNMAKNAQNIYQEKLRPAQMQLAQSLQGATSGINPVAKDAGEYQSTLENLKRLELMGVPGAEARAAAYQDVNKPWTQNAALTGGSMNPNEQASALANNELMKNRYNTMKSFDPKTGQEQLVNESAVRQSVAQGNPFAMGTVPQTKIKDASGVERMVPTSATANAGIPLNPSNQDVAYEDQGIKAREADQQSRVLVNQHLTSLGGIFQQLRNNPQDLGGTTNDAFMRTIGQAIGAGNASTGPQVLDKFAAMMNMAGNANTDAAREILAKSLPSSNMTRDALIKVSNFMQNSLVQQQKMLDAREAVAASLQAKGTSSGMAYTRASQELNKVYDGRMTLLPQEYQNLTSQQLLDIDPQQFKAVAQASGVTDAKDLYKKMYKWSQIVGKQNAQ